jgi:hypothetical protein
VGHLALRHGTLHWRAAARASSYVVGLVAADGSTSTRALRATELRLPKGTRRVIVVGVDVLGRPGRSATFKVPKKIR